MKYNKPIPTDEFFNPMSRFQVGDNINLEDFDKNNVKIFSGKLAEEAENIALKILNLVSEENVMPLDKRDLDDFMELLRGLMDYYQTEEGCKTLENEQ